MKKWFNHLICKTQQRMQSRYGNDELNRAFCITGFLLLLFALCTSFRFLYIPVISLILLICIRCSSRNITKRGAERRAYLSFTVSVRSRFRLQTDKWRDRNSYCYFRCNACKALLLTPKGICKILLRCPKCYHELNAKT